ncbi:arginase [Pelagibacterium luteolum]|uniref:Arginase n=1 Tax=Pelagibacterium luteolum TaxID=440168 RepID=A0A1G7VZ32_9HYPH|nr:arginase [Pelagibacterium luteolum]SDG64709.1 arginase [Pelagibacterium luteolum]
MRGPAPRTISLIGAPLEEGAGGQGCSMGPKALRIAGIAEALAAIGHTVNDLGDVTAQYNALTLSGRAHNVVEVTGLARALADAGEAALQKGTAVYLGGDHALSFGSVAAALRHAERIGKPLHVLWLDAHADFNTPQTSESGNMHGMPAAFFCGEPGFDGMLDCPKLPARHFHLVGARSIDPAEVDLLEARGADVNDMAEIDEFGIGAVLRRILSEVEADDALLHVSLDVDFIEPDLAPGVGTTVPGGATVREAHLVMELINRSNRLLSLDLVELNPFLDDRGKSARLMVELAASGFGKRIFDRPTQPA